jgi:hypothetical protein
MCADCGLKTSATAGTIFHRSHTPLSTWFAAIWFVTSQKNGVSARGLQDALGFGSYETAWAWLHKLRRAMVRPERELLSGVVELDQSFLGGRSHGKPGGATEKAPITIAVERLPSGRLGRVRLDLAEVPNGVDQLAFAREVIAPGTEIHTDGAWVLTRLSDHGFTHRRTPGYLAADLDAVMPGPHLVSSLLKRWAAGTLHHRISRQQLPYYLDEFGLPVQPADLPSARAAVLPAASAGRRHGPTSPQRAHRRHRQRLGRTHRRLSLNCIQADMQDIHSH